MAVSNVFEGLGTPHDPGCLIGELEDVAAVDVPLIGAFDSGAANVHRYRLDLAEAAGIDAFGIDWYAYRIRASPA